MRIRYAKGTDRRLMRISLPMLPIGEPTRGERLIDQAHQALIKVCQPGNTKAQRIHAAKSRQALVNYMKNKERGE